MDASAPRSRTLRVRAARVGLVAAMALATVNVWTGAPLLGLWAGSRVQGAGPTRMESVFVVAIVIGAAGYGLVRLLSYLDEVYGRLTGRPRRVRQHVPWLRSMRGERPHARGDKNSLSPLEIVLVISVVAAVVLFEIWFFFYSGSSIDQRSGRS